MADYSAIGDPTWQAVLETWAKRSDWKQVDEPLPPLSHYTNAEGLLGIFNSNKLWATCAQYSNDISEVVYAQSIARDVITNFFDSRSLSPGGKQLRDFVTTIGGTDGESTDAYLTSFCESSDLLSQWRAYGKAAGFEIRFGSVNEKNGLYGSNALVLDSPFAVRTVLRKVEYGDGAQRTSLSAILERSLAIIEELEKTFKDVPTIVATLSGLELTTWLYTVKHPSFREEQEWRIIAFPKLKVSSLRIQYEVPGVLKFRPGRHSLVPYIELLPKEGHLPISEIVCGPGSNQKLTAKAVELCLRSRGFNRVRVRESKVPLAH